MFETATLTHEGAGKQVLATAAGVTGQAALVACALLVPMIWPANIGRTYLVTQIFAPGPPPPKPVAAKTEVASVTRTRSTAPTHGFTEPVGLPKGIAKGPDVAAPPSDPAPCQACVPDSTGKADDNRGTRGASLLSQLLTPVRAEPAIRQAETHREAIKPPAEAVKPVRVTRLKMATPIYRVDPVYPQLARAARVSGTVELMGVLGIDGRIHELRVLKGHPLLIAAALDAVRQWVYQPTELNGQPVEVAAPINVHFILN